MRFVVSMAYGYFELVSGELADAEAERFALSRAECGEGIGAAAGHIVVLSPHQANSRMPLTFELFPERPLDDAGDWEEVTEADALITDERLTFRSPTTDPIDIHISNGLYRVEISGRGFIDTGWSGRTPPGDEWRLRLWPSHARQDPVRIRRWVDVRLRQRLAVEPRHDLEAAGRAAVSRIRDDLDRREGARSISTEIGDVEVKFSLPGQLNRLAPYLRYQGGWLFDNGGAIEGKVGEEFYFFGHATLDNGIAGSRGRIACRFLSLRRKTSMFTWQWELPVIGPDGAVSAWKPALPVCSKVTFSLTESAIDQATAYIFHESVPSNWVNDLSAFWKWKLDDLRY